MTATKTLDYELPPELIQQYIKAFADIQDVRLLILLLFNSFEEILRSFAAWRLTCPVNKVPFKNNTSFLIELILAGSASKNLRMRIEQFSVLRNTVAHKFHLNDYKQKLRKFVESNSNKSYPDTEPKKRKVLIDAFCDLTLDVATHIDEIQPRSDWPFPFLSLELNAFRS